MNTTSERCYSVRLLAGLYMFAFGPLAEPACHNGPADSKTDRSFRIQDRPEAAREFSHRDSELAPLQGLGKSTLEQVVIFETVSKARFSAASTLGGVNGARQ